MCTFNLIWYNRETILLSFHYLTFYRIFTLFRLILKDQKSQAELRFFFLKKALIDNPLHTPANWRGGSFVCSPSEIGHLRKGLCFYIFMLKKCTHCSLQNAIYIEFSFSKQSLKFINTIETAPCWTVSVIKLGMLCEQASENFYVHCAIAIVS